MLSNTTVLLFTMVGITWASLSYVSDSDKQALENMFNSAVSAKKDLQSVSHSLSGLGILQKKAHNTGVFYDLSENSECALRALVHGFESRDLF